jgi:2-oxoisovalerate dehydrogenase E1 component
MMSKSELPHILIKPQLSEPTLTFITYGGSLETVVASLEELFIKMDVLAQVICLTKIDPLPLELIYQTCKNSDFVITVEEGSKRGGIGSEIISSLAEKLNHVIFKRIASFDCPIPSVKSLEEQVLVNKNLILDEVKKLL